MRHISSAAAWSCPSRGTWIENSLPRGVSAARRVVPLTGHVDRKLRYMVFQSPPHVTSCPSRGTWVEMCVISPASNTSPAALQNCDGLSPSNSTSNLHSYSPMRSMRMIFTIYLSFQGIKKSDKHGGFRSFINLQLSYGSKAGHGLFERRQKLRGPFHQDKVAVFCHAQSSSSAISSHSASK